MSKQRLPGVMVVSRSQPLTTSAGQTVWTELQFSYCIPVLVIQSLQCSPCNAAQCWQCSSVLAIPMTLTIFRPCYETLLLLGILSYTINNCITRDSSKTAKYGIPKRTKLDDTQINC